MNRLDASPPDVEDPRQGRVPAPHRGGRSVGAPVAAMTGAPRHPARLVERRRASNREAGAGVPRDRRRGGALTRAARGAARPDRVPHLIRRQSRSAAQGRRASQTATPTG